jgi:lipopolysaccharide/colanic/teichoic acid biosynthesis glycosyltransferase
MSTTLRSGSACDREGGESCPRVLDEEPFRRVLIGERKRADRSRQAFILLLVRVSDRRDTDASSIRESVVGALTAAKREMDILGWCERPTEIGLIVPEIRASEVAAAYDRLEARGRRALAGRLDAETVADLSMRRHVYPEPRRAGGEEPWPVDPILYPELRACRARRSVYDAMKRRLDVAGSLTLLAVLSPLLLLTAVAVKLSSPGPVFFRQVRIGHMMRPFTMLKFRTMYTGADPWPHHEFVSRFIKGNGQVHEPGKNRVFKLTNDPRVTPLGRILRRTSLDELPQLWNVLRGDMSLVGPRPPLPYELEQYEPWHRRRVLEAKPGVTGLWQVAGRSRTTFDEMVRLDLRYARTRSLWTDVKILLETPAAVISGKGAR